MALLLVPLLCGASAAQEGPKSDQQANLPVDIRSDRLVVKQKRNQAVFSGNVRAVQGDLTIHCDRLVVSYQGSEEGSKRTGEIRTMVFTGSVSIGQGERKGHCQKAEYDRPSRQLECIGDAWVVEGDNRIEGERILYKLNQDEVVVIRPKAVIRLEDADQQEDNKQ
jgi:lipopolysaccharide export system protein LptA